MVNLLCDVLKECYSRGWITSRDGNISFHEKDSNILIISPSGVLKNKLKFEDLLKLQIVDNELIVPDNCKPSGELHMHWMIQKNSNKTTTVLHAHPTNVIAAMYAGWDLTKLAKEFPELGRYTTVAPSVPVLPVTSKVLGDVTYEHLKGFGYTLQPPPNGGIYDIVGQENHGVCVVAYDPLSAFEHIERLDHICEIVLKSGIKPNSGKN